MKIAEIKNIYKVDFAIMPAFKKKKKFEESRKRGQLLLLYMKKGGDVNPGLPNLGKLLKW